MEAGSEDENFANVLDELTTVEAYLSRRQAEWVATLHYQDSQEDTCSIDAEVPTDIEKTYLQCEELESRLLKILSKLSATKCPSLIVRHSSFIIKMPKFLINSHGIPQIIKVISDR